MAKNKTRVKQPQFTNRCIFCGGTGLTKQHIISNWINREFPPVHTNHTMNPVYIEHTEAGVKIFGESINKQGSVSSKKIKNVCGECNSKWMSVLENKAKPHIIKLINRISTSFDHTSLTHVAAWVMLTTVMFEYDQPSQKAISRSDRQFLMNNFFPPDSWEIFVGITSSSNMNRRLRHAGGYMVIKEFAEQLRTKLKNVNHQGTIIGINNIVFASRCPSDTATIKYSRSDVLTTKFIQIWPLSDELICFPINEIITEQELEYVFENDLHVPTANFIRA